MRCLLFSLAVLIGVSAFSQQDPATVAYIDKYKAWARTEMQRSGIPASITLSQGILESGSGQSRLATQGNNHFGIKCHKGWTGKKIFADDDAKGECFRKYESAHESFVDHSDFLMTRDRYAFLFQIPKEDYKAWARGLKKAGYATSPVYAESLIKLIERYDLNRYDAQDVPVLVQDIPVVHTTTHSYSTEVVLVNRVKTVFLQPHQTLKDVATEHEMRLSWLEDYNEVGSGSLEHGMHVFLQPKRKKADVKYHTVNENETMYFISQLHGIKLSALYKKNLLQPGQEVATGEVLHMRKKRKTPPRTRSAQPVPPPLPKDESNLRPEPRPEVILPETPTPEPEAATVDTFKQARTTVVIDTVSSQPVEESFEPKHVFAPADSLIAPAPVDDPLDPAQDEVIPVPEPEAVSYLYHEVAQGETLYSLSRRYKTTVPQLKEWNALEGDTIKTGHSIIVGIEP